MSQVMMQAEVNAKYAHAEVSINGRTYQLYISKTLINIATGNAILLRSTGKAFFNLEAVAKHYKKDGAALVEMLSEMKRMTEDAAMLVS